MAKAVKTPIVLYNLPARTGNNINYATVKRLAEFDTIVGIKDSSGNFDNTLRYLDDTDPRLKVLAGNDSLILSTLMAGGTGAISGWSNVFPKLICSIYDHWRAGRLDEARKAQNAIRPFRDVMALGNPNSVVKRAMNLLGHPVGPAREPASGTDPRIDEALAARVPELSRVGPGKGRRAMNKVVLTHRLHDKGMALLEGRAETVITQTGDPQAMAPALADADGLIIRIGSNRPARPCWRPRICV